MKRGFLRCGAPPLAKAAAATMATEVGSDLSKGDETPTPPEAARPRKKGFGRSCSCGGGVRREQGEGLCLCTDKTANQAPPTASEGRQPDWSALPDLPLCAIARRLPAFKDFLSFRGVCASWRFVGRAVEGAVIASHPPLFFEYRILPRFYHLAETRFYHKKQPTKTLLDGEGLVYVAGSSHGHLILRRGCVVWLWNPLTGADAHCFPRTHRSFDHAMLSSPPTTPGCVLVAYDFCSIHYCRAGGKDWCAVYRPGEGLYQIYGVAIVGEKGYVLLDGRRLATFDFTGNAGLTILGVEHMPLPALAKNYVAIFAESKGELFAFSIPELDLVDRFEVSRFDSMGCKWVRSEDLGGRVVFLGPSRGSMFVDNYAEWGGSKDCVYLFHPAFLPSFS